MHDGDFDYVALGHYHEFHEHKGNSYYAGATERFGFGEVGAKTGFAIVEFDGQRPRGRRARPGTGAAHAGPGQDHRPRDGLLGSHGRDKGAHRKRDLDDAMCACGSTTRDAA
jgi:hypothetical protein